MTLWRNRKYCHNFQSDYHKTICIKTTKNYIFRVLGCLVNDGSGPISPFTSLFLHFHTFKVRLSCPFSHSWHPLSNPPRRSPFEAHPEFYSVNIKCFPRIMVAAFNVVCSRFRTAVNGGKKNDWMANSDRRITLSSLCRSHLSTISWDSVRDGILVLKKLLGSGTLGECQCLHFVMGEA